MKINEVKFIKSSARLSQCPDKMIPEIALVGRSNVGKSSLLNMLMNYKGLAKISSKPGKTQLINHFEVNSSFYLVDLPGYGWAKVSKTVKDEWEKSIHEYLVKRKNLEVVFVLIDARHDLLKNDLEFINWLGNHNIPVSLIITKSDKEKPTLLQRRLKKLKDTLLKYWESVPDILITSSKEKLGREQLLKYINSIVKQSIKNRK